MRVKALQYMYYNRRGYNAGEEYEMDDREEAEVKLLCVLGKVALVESSPSKQTQPPPSYHASSMKAEEHSTSAEPMKAEDDNPLTSPRRYRRRDMRADK